MTTFGRGSARAARLQSTDTRSSSTQRLLVDALTAVVQSEGFDKATATRIAHEAGLSRSGFYEHFANIDELSLFVLDTLLSEATAIDLDARQHATTPDQQTVPEYAVEALLAAVQQRRDLFQHMLLSNRTGRTVGRAMERVTQSTRTVVEVIRPEESSAQLDLYAAAIGGTVLGMVMHYLRTDDDRPAAELAREVIALMPDWMYSWHHRVLENHQST